MSYVVRIASLAFGLLGAAFPAVSRAGDVSHTVARGHTLEAIAHRYHVTAKAIVDANHLRDPKHLKIGETLTIPGVAAPPPAAKGKATPRGVRDAHDARDAKPQVPIKPIHYEMRAKTPGVVHATRLATGEDFTIRVNSRRGRQAPTASNSFEKMLRSSANLAHPIDPRLIALVGIVSNHFGSRKLEVVSGFRPFTPTQHTQHSNHNVGKAIDFRVAGVPNEVLRDYCKTLHNVGVGYYPSSTFVHLDVRAAPAFWIDYSRPGEPPRYNSREAIGEADEGTSDVAEEPHAIEPPESPSAAAPPSEERAQDTAPVATPAGSAPAAPAVPGTPLGEGSSPAPSPTPTPLP